jgi:hypothetical protein
MIFWFFVFETDEAENAERKLCRWREPAGVLHRLAKRKVIRRGVRYRVGVWRACIAASRGVRCGRFYRRILPMIKPATNAIATDLIGLSLR